MAAGINKARVGEIVSPITEMVSWDLVNEVWGTVPKEIFSQGPALGKDIKVVRKELVELLMKSNIGSATDSSRSYLEEIGGWTPEVKTKVAEYDKFRRTGQLPSHDGGETGMPE